jgi:polyhydroxybutyrate depolymerase
MRKNYPLIFLLTIIFNLASLGLSAQKTIVDSILHKGLQRNFRVYIPKAYSAAKATPLILNFHGYTSNATQQEAYGDFRSIADTANIILVHPNGTGSPQSWNNFTIPGTGVDDIGFVSTLLDTLQKRYNIDKSRIYSTGMSNGGFMSYDLACFLGNRIAAIASVTGSMATTHLNACKPAHPIPVMEIHGTSDNTVPYTGGSGFVAIDSLVRFWVKYNKSTLTPVVTQLPDINKNDGSTVERQVFAGTDCNTVELYKVIGGGHAWPGAVYNTGGTNYDFNASKEIWRFFSKCSLNTTTGEHLITKNDFSCHVYPNPARDQLYIQIEGPVSSNISLQLYNTTGQLVKSLRSDHNSFLVQRDGLAAGLYIATVSGLPIPLTTKVLFE